jgi:hypothetical protein
MSIGTKIKTNENGPISPMYKLGLIDEIQRYTMEKEDLGPFPLQWKALEALN